MSEFETALIYALDISGTFVFAISGAFKAVKYELDFLGLLVLAAATGIGGGILRDVVIGYTPPSAFRNEIYFIICLVAAAIVFFAAPKIAKRWDIVMIADAVGLGVFTAIGTMKAVESGMGPIGILLLGAATATGGGVVRDILVREIPYVIRKDFYATASLLGGLVPVILINFETDKTIIIFACMFVTILSRLAAMRFKFELPHVHSLPDSPTVMTKKFKTKRR
ncbi:MAG: trimeric intracellular cation channel family protein [Spirochaetota bacterium]